MHKGAESPHGRKESSSFCLGYSKRPRGIWFPNAFGPNGADTLLTLALLENCKSGFLKGVFPCVLLSASSKPESLSSGQSVSDGLGMQSQESHKFPQALSVLTYNLIWAESSSQGRSNPRSQKEKLDAHLLSTAVGSCANPRAESGQSFKTEALKHCTKGESWFQRDRTIELHLVYKTKPLHRKSLFGLFLMSALFSPVHRRVIWQLVFFLLYHFLSEKTSSKAAFVSG